MQPEMQHTNSDLSISVLYPAISSFVFQGSQETCRGAVICRVAGIRAIHLMLLLWNRSFFLVITYCCPWFLSQLPWPATLAISYRIIFFIFPGYCFLFWILELGTIHVDSPSSVIFTFLYLSTVFLSGVNHGRAEPDVGPLGQLNLPWGSRGRGRGRLWRKRQLPVPCSFYQALCTLCHSPHKPGVKHWLLRA